MNAQDLFEMLRKVQEPKGFFFNKDRDRVFDLLEALLANDDAPAAASAAAPAQAEAPKAAPQPAAQPAAAPKPTRRGSPALTSQLRSEGCSAGSSTCRGLSAPYSGVSVSPLRDWIGFTRYLRPSSISAQCTNRN